MTLADEVIVFARSLGFDRAGIVPVARPGHAAVFADWLAAGYHGEMAYLAARAAERLDPAAWLGEARSLIMTSVNYAPDPPPLAWLDPAHGRIARYAWMGDYHDLIKARLFALDAFIRERTGRTTLGKACVDTAPLLERDFADRAGLGFTGRNTCLITPGLGSWTFLGALAVPEQLDEGPRSKDRGPKTEDGGALVLRPSSFGGCGKCTRCLDACPTHAFVGPHVLDSRRCISYLTIELRGPIPRELRPLMGNWVFGCDVCQEVCPYNRAPARSGWASLDPEVSRVAPSLLELLALDEAAFRARFRGTAVLRTKRRGLVRNACVAAGNWGDPAAVPALARLLSDHEPLIRGHAAWALGRIGGAMARQALHERLTAETDAWVREEVAAAL